MDWDTDADAGPTPPKMESKGRGFGAKQAVAASAPVVDDWASSVISTEASGGNDWASSVIPTEASGGNDWASTVPSNGWDTGSGGGGGRGRGSRGGGGGGSNACFKCNEEGHMSRECPKSGGDSRSCYNCGGSGHMSRECTEPKKERGGGGGGGGGGGSRACFRCGSEDHMSRECDKPDTRKCHKCQKPGHYANNCTESGDNGSNPWDTTTKASDGGGSGLDDWGTGTGNASASGGGGRGNKDSNDKGCRKCGKEGHFARECTEEKLGADGKPLPPLYMPALLDENDESIFDTISSGINFDRYDKIPVNVTGKDVPKQITTFPEAITSDLLLGVIKKCNYSRPTPVQSYGIPIVKAGRDLMACAQTGSGKTLAFTLPVIQNLFDDKELSDSYGTPCQEPYCVVLTPTRELAIQIHQEAFKFSRGSIVKAQIVYGGTSSGYQLSQLSKGTHILVATPGRLLDFVDKGKISFSKLKFLILDEADRMIDQGFMPDIRRMIANSTMPPKGKKQMLMFSATFPDEVQRLAAEFLAEDYIFLTVGMVGAANADVEQKLMKVERFEKRKELQQLLGACDIQDRTMVFVQTKKTADFLAAFLSQNGYKSTSIHGDRFQKQREEALNDFRSGKMPILVATSVASRGLDINDVRHVINYDLPSEIDDYVHRIGRTGRVGNLGKATSFFDPSSDRELASSLLKILSDAGQEAPDWLIEESKGMGSSGGGFSSGGFGGFDVRKNQGPDPVPSSTVDDSWD